MAAALALTGLLNGCTGPAAGQRAVFEMADPSFSYFGGTHIEAITDVGVPLFANLTNSTVKLVSVRLVDPPPALHVLSVDAYRREGLLFGQIPWWPGSLPAECPKFFGHPSPVTAVSVAPKADVNWLVIIVFTISKPGRYHFGRAKITYSISGVKGWQYQNMNVALTVKPPPDRRLNIDDTICR